MSHSTKRRALSKPAKPREDFPLFPHASGRWAKKVRGRFAYFGKVADDPDGVKALDLWLKQRDYLLSGQKPPAEGEKSRLTVRELLNKYLTAKKLLIDKGERSARYMNDLLYTANRIAKVFGRGAVVEFLGPDDFARLAADMAKTLGVVARRTEISKTRSFFRYAFDCGLVDKPVRFGPDFRAPSEVVLRKHRQKVRQEHGLRMFQPDELRRLLDSVKPELRAMVLLGINCGYGNNDIATLSLSSLDLVGGWIDFPRPKTGIPRRCPLWPETTQALRDVLSRRPEPRNNAHSGLVFLTRRFRQPYVRLTKNGNPTDHIGACLDVHMNKLGIKRAGLSFYAMRHTFETVAGETKDQVAVDALMGHVDGTMAGQYRERISDERLLVVVDHVRKWLFGTEETK